MQNRHWPRFVLVSTLALASGACSSASTPQSAQSAASDDADAGTTSAGQTSSGEAPDGGPVPGSTSDGASSGGGSAGSVDSTTSGDSTSGDTTGSGAATGTGGSTGSGAPMDAGADAPPPVMPNAPMPLISLSMAAQANYALAPAPDAVDSDYSTVWRTAHVPSVADPNWIAIDLSSVPQIQRTSVYSVWFNEYGYNYDTSDGSSYTLPGDFEIQANVAAGGGAAPAGGWVTLVSVKGNVLSSGANLLNLSGYDWVRIHCTASAANSAAQNDDLSLQWNLFDAHEGNDGWKFGGDSITANSMGHKSTNDSFDQLIHQQVANVPAFEMAGHGGWSTTTMLGAIDAFLANFPGRYFALSLGTNDAGGNDPVAYHDRMVQLIDKVLAAGKVPVVPTIPYTGDPGHAPIPAHNDQIQALYAQYGSKLVKGPDLYAVIYAGRAAMFDNPTDLHPNAVGNAAIRQAWAATMLTNVYGK